MNHMCVHACVYVSVRVCACMGGRKCNVVNATLSQRIWESTFLRCDNVNSQRCHNQKATLSQRCHNVILFAGKLLTMVQYAPSHNYRKNVLSEIEVKYRKVKLALTSLKCFLCCFLFF